MIGLGFLYRGAAVFIRNRSRGLNLFVAAAVFAGLALAGMTLNFFATEPVFLAVGAVLLGCWLTVKARAARRLPGAALDVSHCASSERDD